MDDLINIPIDISSQRPILKLKINGKGPYDFIFDTGSGGNVIDEELAKELGLTVIGQDSLRTPGSDNFLISQRVKASEVSVTGIPASKDVIMNTMAIRKMLPVDGILSPAFFAEYLLTIDYQNYILTVEKGELQLNSSGVIPLKDISKIINFDITVNDIAIEGHLDSGNPGWITLPYSYKDKLVFISEPVDDGIIQTPVASFRKWKATLNGKIKIGAIIYENPEIILAEGLQFANIGYQFFQDAKIVIDSKNKIIGFEKNIQVNTPPTVLDQQEETGETNDYTGLYGERRIFLDNGKLMLQRGGASKLELVNLEEDYFKMVFKLPVQNELPNVKFRRDSSGKVIGLTFIYKDGREDYIKKD